MPRIVFANCKAVKDIRSSLQNLPIEPVVYRWWFLSIPEIMGNTELDFNKIEQRKIDGKLYYALYVGIGKSCKQRFGWHIAQHHTQSNVKHGTLSTLRQTLSAVLGMDMTKSEYAVNQLMNTCYLEWNTYPGLTKNDLEDIETSLLQDGYYPLNIQKNKNIPASWLKTLRDLRKGHKE